VARHGAGTIEKVGLRLRCVKTGAGGYSDLIPLLFHLRLERVAGVLPARASCPAPEGPSRLDTGISPWNRSQSTHFSPRRVAVTCQNRMGSRSKSISPSFHIRVQSVFHPWLVLFMRSKSGQQACGVPTGHKRSRRRFRPRMKHRLNTDSQESRTPKCDGPGTSWNDDCPLGQGDGGNENRPDCRYRCQRISFSPGCAPADRRGTGRRQVKRWGCAPAYR
jgi:hypothetical protein